MHPINPTHLSGMEEEGGMCPFFLSLEKTNPISFIFFGFPTRPIFSSSSPENLGLSYLSLTNSINCNSGTFVSRSCRLVQPGNRFFYNDEEHLKVSDWPL